MTLAPALSVSGIVIGDSTIAFDLEPGEILAVLGENGAGKSLLLACLSGRLRPPAGSVRIAGREPHAARSDVGVLSQHHGLLRNMTVFQNVALPFLGYGLDLDDALEQQVLLRLRLVGCAHLAREEVHLLSEGDKRCVALARALSGRPRLLIADEPLAALSPGKQKIIEELLASLVKTGALSGMVLATHDIDFARRIATRLLLLRAGGHTLIRREDATHDELGKSFITRSP